MPEPARNNKRQQQKAQTRARLLEAAKGVFAKHGYEAASVAQIAKAAGVARGALYVHFETKQALFRDIQLDYIEQRSAATAARIHADMPLYDAIREITESAWALHQNGVCGSALSTEFFALAGRSDWDRSATASIFRHCTSLLTDFLEQAKKRGDVRPDLDCLMAARMMLALHDGLILQWQSQPDEINRADHITPMVDMIFAYVSNKGNAS